MFKCWKKKTPPKPIKLPNHYPNSVNFALVIGHNVKSQGAVNYLNESEYKYNSRIARKLQLKLDDSGFKSIILKRPIGSYSYQSRAVRDQCLEEGITHTLHLHFNSFKKIARGCEVIIAMNSVDIDNKLADRITDKLEIEFGLIQRHDGGIKTIKKGDRGGTMLYTLQEAGIIPCLVEPIFANFRSPMTQLFFEQEERYIKILSDSILELFK